MVDERRQVNVKIPLELWEELEKSDLLRQKIVTDALELYFHRDLQTPATNEIDFRSEIEYLRDENKKLMELLGREQGINMTVQQRLLSESKADEHIVKKWWQFWKK